MKAALGVRVRAWLLGPYHRWCWRKEARRDAERWIAIGTCSVWYNLKPTASSFAYTKDDGGREWRVRWMLKSTASGKRKAVLLDKHLAEKAAWLGTFIREWENGGPLPAKVDLYGATFKITEPP